MKAGLKKAVSIEKIADNHTKTQVNQEINYTIIKIIPIKIEWLSFFV